MAPPIDVIIIGAGLSGLTAARHIQASNLSYLVLEARDRVGGKTLSFSPSPNQTIDLGAAWINDTNQSEVYALARELNLALVVQNTEGKIIQETESTVSSSSSSPARSSTTSSQPSQTTLTTFPYGSNPPLSPNDLSELLKIRHLFESTCQELNIFSPSHLHLDTLTLRQWIDTLTTNPIARTSINVWTRAMLGLEPHELSALFFLNYCKSGGGLLQMRKDTPDGGQYLRFQTGSQSLSKGLATMLRSECIKLSTPVLKISQEKGQVEVGTRNEVFGARRVIVTIPTTLYESIVFEPELPEGKKELCRGSVQGYTNKVIIRYESPWWRDRGYCGLIQSFVGPVTVTRDSSVDEDGQFSMTCFLVGEHGRKVRSWSKEERVGMVREHVERVFRGVGVEIGREIGVEEYQWVEDQWSGGCPVPAMGIGVMTKWERSLRENFDRIHFGGTETSFEWKGYMDGAVRSGKRVAEEVVEEFDNAKL